MRPYHVLNPWTWLPEVKVDDIAIRVTNASAIMGHLRYMPREEIERKLELLAVERQKFSFQPFITGPYSAINIILAHICSMPPPGEQVQLPALGQVPGQGQQPDPEGSLLPVQTQLPVQSLLPVQTLLPGQPVPVQSQSPAQRQEPVQTESPVQSQVPVETPIPVQTQVPVETPVPMQSWSPELPVQSPLPVQQLSQQVYPHGRR